MGLKRGARSRQNSIVSTIRRSDGSAGNTQVPRETYSLRMSFWVVPRICSGGTPCFSASARYIARMTAAVPLIVNDVET